jgi:lysophospholipase L1-like esterase
MRPHQVALLLALLAPITRAAEKPFTLPDNPVIAFIGNTVAERDQQHGYFETRLIESFPDKNIIYRNLGWSGDTVQGQARARFGQAIDGFNHIVAHVADYKPNVIFLNYGLNEAFAGPAGLDTFNQNLKKMLDMLSKGNPQIVIFSIMQQEKLAPPLPDPASENENIKLYNAALAKAAADRGLRFVDLYEVPVQFAAAHPGQHLTANEIHPTPEGYRFLADAIIKSLSLPTPPPSGNFEPIRKLTIEKNRLYFHRWRPENETYIFGFRKAEQGKNAVEIPKFDPLIAAKEAEINKLKK